MILCWTCLLEEIILRISLGEVNMIGSTIYIVIGSVYIGSQLEERFLSEVYFVLILSKPSIGRELETWCVDFCYNINANFIFNLSRVDTSSPELET